MTRPSIMPGFVVEEFHWERRRGLRGLVDLVRRRKPVRVIDPVRLT